MLFRSGGGFPVGACLATDRAAAGMTKGTHGSTFGGNPLACRVANAVLDVLESPGFLELASERGDRLRAGLEAVALRHPDLVAEVRGVGLMLGLVVRGDGAAADLQAALRRRRVLVATAGPDVVRLVPPLVIDEVEIDRAVAAIDAAAGELAAG